MIFQSKPLDTGKYLSTFFHGVGSGFKLPTSDLEDKCVTHSTGRIFIIKKWEDGSWSNLDLIKFCDPNIKNIKDPEFLICLLLKRFAN